MLEKIKQIKTNINSGQRAQSLILNNASEKTNKLETVPFNITDESINEILKQSNFKMKRKKLGRMLSLEGEAMVLVLPFNNTYIVDVLRVTEYERVGKFNIMMEGVSGAQEIHNDKLFDIFTKLHFVNDKPTLTRYIIVEGEQVLVGQDWTFNTNSLPGEIFLNNEEGLSDVAYAGVVVALERLDYHDSMLRAEWERTRTRPNYNTNFTDLDPAQDTNAIDNGQSYDLEDAYDSKYGAGKVIMPATAGTTILQFQIDYLEKDIKRKLGMQIDTVESGSNQHNLEMIMSNEFGNELLEAKREEREDMWLSFFEKLAEVLGVSAPEFKLELAYIAKAKRDLLEAAVSEAKMKSQNVASQQAANGENEGE